MPHADAAQNCSAHLAQETKSCCLRCLRLVAHERCSDSSGTGSRRGRRCCCCCRGSCRLARGFGGGQSETLGGPAAAAADSPAAAALLPAGRCLCCRLGCCQLGSRAREGLAIVLHNSVQKVDVPGGGGCSGTVHEDRRAGPAMQSARLPPEQSPSSTQQLHAASLTSRSLRNHEARTAPAQSP